MTWIPLLLTDPSPSLRYKVLTELLNYPESDSEVKELSELRETDPFYQRISQAQRKDGSWIINSVTQTKTTDVVNTTAIELNRLGYLGFNNDYELTQKGAEFLFSKQNSDGSWPLGSNYALQGEEDKYEMMPVQTAIPLIGLARCGYAEDKRSEKAYEWLLNQKLEDGAWPVGINSGVYGGIAGYRKLAHSRWGCRSNTTAVLRALSFHSKRKSGENAKRAVDLILSTDIKSRRDLGFYIARILGAETTYGRITYYAKFDLSLILDLCWRIGASVEDERIKSFVDFIREEQGDFGFWEYQQFPKISKWLTYDLLKSLSRLEKTTDWFSLEPKTPFQQYPKKLKRF